VDLTRNKESIHSAKIAYFSMEVGLDPALPTYSGGLGVLAGDTIRSAADLRVPMVGVTLLHRKGYFLQRLDPNGEQREEPVEWVIEDFLKEDEPFISVPGDMRLRVLAVSRSLSISWMSIFRKTLRGTGLSPIFSMGGISITGSVRRWFWASAAPEY
jgi:glucan phosphorylase